MAPVGLRLEEENGGACFYIEHIRCLLLHSVCVRARALSIDSCIYFSANKPVKLLYSELDPGSTEVHVLRSPWQQLGQSSFVTPVT